MSSDDGMNWLGRATPVSEREEALEGAGSAARLALFNLVRGTFDSLSKERKLTKRELADNLGVSGALVSRWLVKPANMTIESAAKLLYAMGRELRLSVEKRPAPHRELTYGENYFSAWFHTHSASRRRAKTITDWDELLDIRTRSSDNIHFFDKVMYFESKEQQMILLHGVCSKDGFYRQVTHSDAMLGNSIEPTSKTNASPIKATAREDCVGNC